MAKMTCKDCIHFKICNDYVYLVGREDKVACPDYKSTADVVPRSEVEKIFAEIHKEIELALDSNYKARNANGYGEFGEYLNGKIHALRGIEDFLAELKKKYIGDTTDGGVSS